LTHSALGRAFIALEKISKEPLGPAGEDAWQELQEVLLTLRADHSSLLLAARKARYLVEITFLYETALETGDEGATSLLASARARVQGSLARTLDQIPSR
jgi:hypothetical protein